MCLCWILLLFQFSFLYLGGVFNETILVTLVWSLCLGMGEVNLTVVFILELQISKLHFNQINILLRHHLPDLINLPKSELRCQKITISTSREVNGNSELWGGGGRKNLKLKTLKRKV